MPTTTVLRAQVKLADAVRDAARQARDEAGALPMPTDPIAAARARSSYQGAQAAYEQRIEEARVLRVQLIRRTERDYLRRIEDARARRAQLISVGTRVEHRGTPGAPGTVVKIDRDDYIVRYDHDGQQHRAGRSSLVKVGQ